jgi:predicted kinase
VLTAVGGRSGTGKTVLARLAAPRLGPAPGAVILRTDEIRKRIWGAAAHEALPDAAYAADVTRRTYQALFDEAAHALAAGRGVVLDATFLDPALRARAAETARAAGVSFQGVWLEAPAEVLRARVAGRRGDASDATVAILEAQLSTEAGLMDWTVLDASGAPDRVAAAWSRVAQRPASL